LEASANMTVVAHLHTASKALWDAIPPHGAPYTDGVGFAELLQLVSPNQR
jgi:hypothetical protein